MIGLPILPWQMRSWTAWSTTRIVWNSLANPCAGLKARQIIAPRSRQRLCNVTLQIQGETVMPPKRKYETNGSRQAAYRLRQANVRQAERAEKGLPSLPPIASLPGHPRWRTAIRYALALLTLVHDEMVAYFDDRSEVWQES